MAVGSVSVGRTVAVLAAAVSLGLLEAAWTGPGRGAPTDVWLGVFAISVALLVVAWPRWYLVPGLAIVEEWTHLVTGYGVWLPTADTFLRHWSVSFLGGLNIYPWLTFPVFTLAAISISIYLSRAKA